MSLNGKYIHTRCSVSPKIALVGIVIFLSISFWFLYLLITTNGSPISIGDDNSSRLVMPGDDNYDSALRTAYLIYSVLSVTFGAIGCIAVRMLVLDIKKPRPRN